ncbi:DUF3157 family protein [Vibrio sp. SS-MA-C1-2]|uniref:DUF3157 family protein n=1 Tax=Vibrio sp. SS-MA-C1-2 TaxID=2908646 RepID=UPI001F45BA98|nr:DUF3157 family protein [Vibrio sp. SS-MA-C1-2]UJF18322.1 DUF3157 family protein [Vibrio sp. SS-MA-C1-2]
MIKFITGFLFLILSCVAYAQSQSVILKNGKIVILNDDFTWHYKKSSLSGDKTTKHSANTLSQITASSVAASKMTSSSTSETVTTPVKETQTIFPSTQSMPSEPYPPQIIITKSPIIMNTVTVSNTAQQKHILLENDRIIISSDNIHFDKDQLVIPTSVKNISNESIIYIAVDLYVSTEDGQQIKQEKVKIWSSIKRMPETYLRENTTQKGHTIKIKMKKASGYHLSFSINKILER